MGLTVLSLFDGMSCGQIALERAGIKVDKYFASEIKNHAIKVTKHNYPNTIHIGDVTKVSYSKGILYTENGEFKVGKIDLLIGGSPCQDFSIANTLGKGGMLGLEGNRSKFFYEYLRLLKEINPKNFLLENVRMKKDSEQQLNQYLGVNGVHINSKLVSYQSRPRIYWSNFKIDVPKDKNIYFNNFVGSFNENLEEFKVNPTPSRIKMWSNGVGDGGLGSCINITNSEKIGCITRKQDRCPNSGLIEYGDFCRYLSRRELEYGQTVPLGYTDIVSYNQAQDLLGDGWTVDVIAHIFKGLGD